MRREGREAYERLRTSLIVAAQAGVAAELSWFITGEVLDNPEPLFAPGVAVGVIAGAIGNRIRRAAEVVAGVVAGAVVAHLITLAIGVGPVQTGVVVALAITGAVLLRGGGAVMAQAGGTALLLSSVARGPDLAVARTESALVGGVTAIVVAFLILPLNPVRVLRRTAGKTMDAFARELTAIAKALADRDLPQADGALQRFTAEWERRQQTTVLIAAARQVTVLSPWRRRWMAMIRRFDHAAAHLESAYTSAHEMVQCSVATVRAGEPVPAGLPASIEFLGQALRLLHREFFAGQEPDRMRARALRAIEEIDEACAEGVGSYGNGVVLRARTFVSELLQASGILATEANKQAGIPSDT